MIYGRHPILELLRAAPSAVEQLLVLPQHLAPQSSWQEVLETCRAHNVRVRTCERQELDDLVGDVVHQGAVAEVRPFAYAPLAATLGPQKGAAGQATPPLVLVLDQVQDPHNLGALTRSAAALGATGVVIAQDRSAEMTATAIKASAGAAYTLPIAQVVNLRRALDTLRSHGLWVAGLAAEGTSGLDELDWRVGMALVVGAEGEGLRPLVAKACDWLVSVPIARVGSLNASVAGAIALYAAARQRAAPAKK